MITRQSPTALARENMIQIAHIETPFASKFGVPRQAGLADYACRVVFEPDYRVAEAVRGLEEFDYVWLLWHFHQAERPGWSPTVRPPRLGGNKRVGVFASRSPFRPNAIGLSAVRLLAVETLPDLGPTLLVAGADLVDHTPILDIKPYIPYADAHPDARSGFATEPPRPSLRVTDPLHRLEAFPPDQRHALCQCLALDPRPHYQNDPTRLYGLPFGGAEVHFRVADGVVEVVDVNVKKS